MGSSFKKMWRADLNSKEILTEIDNKTPQFSEEFYYEENIYEENLLKLNFTRLKVCLITKLCVKLLALAMVI